MHLPAAGNTPALSLESAQERDIEIFFDLKKSHVDAKTGRIHVRGIASDNSIDFTNEIVQISKVGNSLSVLNRGWGKFNYDHGKEIVGEITALRFITPDEALAKYGVECTGVVMEIEGFVYAITDKTRPDSDVRKVHEDIEAGARLGFSVQGGVGNRIPITAKNGQKAIVAVPSFVNQVAITHQPVNMNTVCIPFAKSLAAYLLDGGDGELLKSVGLGSSGGQALVGATGGDATRLGASDKGDTPPVCSTCGAASEDENACCKACGTMGLGLRKSLLGASFEHYAAARGLELS
ncbi:hypothetical protein EON83_11025 [bacterium]|nr:MAG: hypothetical protein EON83_11025 [bacterium]